MDLYFQRLYIRRARQYLYYSKNYIIIKSLTEIYRSRRKAVNYFNRKLFFFVIILLETVALGQSNKTTYSVSGIIESISEAEKKIKTIEAHLNSSVPNGSKISSDWGYQGGKEYLWGTENNPATVYKNREVPENIRTFKYSFDGDKLITFYHTTLQPQKTQAVISEYISSCFSSILRPTAFLGFDISSGPTTLSETLRLAKSVNIREKTEMIDGHPCAIIEAIGIVLPDRPMIKDALIWIDTERDFRPLRIKHYESIGGKNRWKVLQCVEDEIILKQINGIWIPVFGKRTHYNTVNITLPEGMTEDYYTSLPPETRKENLIITVEPSKYGTNVSDINENSIKLNQNIDPNKFSFKPPDGCIVFYNYSDQTYANENILNKEFYLKSLIDKNLPDINDLNINLKQTEIKNNPILICFWDYEQRPSRNCVVELNKMAKELKEKDIQIIAVQASKIGQATLDEWMKENNISFPVGMINDNVEQTRFNWGVKALPWLIITDKNHIVQAEGFSIAELD